MWFFTLIFWIVMPVFLCGAVIRISKQFGSHSHKWDNLYQTILPAMWVLAIYVIFYFGVINLTVDINTSNAVSAVIDLFLAVCWISIARDWYKIWKNDGDGRWKKRAKKALGVVQVAGHKLVVVPETAEVRA